MDFLIEYGTQLEEYFITDRIHWGLDQDLLEGIVKKYNWGQLPKKYIDWDMKARSFIWTAKGTRKDTEIFFNEKEKYSNYNTSSSVIKGKFIKVFNYLYK